jgi:hypothetical protein
MQTRFLSDKIDTFLSQRNDNIVQIVVRIIVFVICGFVRFPTFTVLFAVTADITLDGKCLSGTEHVY